jgi:hypothetical protein
MSCNAYPTALAESVCECWDDLTRPSECAKDGARDPVTDPNGSGAHRTSRIHWINTRIDDFYDIMRAIGTERFGEEFHLSKLKGLDLKRYYHRYPGRDTCLCRYHMEFQNHFVALRKWKAAARRELPKETQSTLCVMPGSARELREFLQFPKAGEYHGQRCTDRKCVKCKNNLRSRVTAAEIAAAPMITYQHWSEVPLVTKDPRTIINHIFLTAEAPISEFLDLFETHLRRLLPYHNHAKFLDNNWKSL